MNARIWLTGLVVTASLALIGCGGGSSGGGSAASSQPTASSVSSGGSSSSTGVSSATKTLSAANALIVGGITEDMLGILNTTQPAGAALRSAAARTVVQCESGSMNIQPGTTSTSMTFNQCMNGGTTLNGSMTATNLSSSGNSTSGTYTFNAFTVTDGSTTTYLNATYTATVSYSGATLNSYDVSLNGTFEISKDGATQRYVFTNYEASVNSNQLTVNGTVSIQNDPNVCEANGDYTVQTIAPITVDVNGNVIGGTIKVNGDTIVYNSDGTATVNGQTVSLSELDTCTA